MFYDIFNVLYESTMIVLTQEDFIHDLTVYLIVLFAIVFLIHARDSFFRW